MRNLTEIKSLIALKRILNTIMTFLMCVVSQKFEINMLLCFCTSVKPRRDICAPSIFFSRVMKIQVKALDIKG